MREEPIRESVLEDQQHQAIRRLAHGFELERRDFVKLLGGGVLVCLCASSGLAQESGAARRADSAEKLPDSIAAWLHVAEDGAVTAYTGKVEMGQNIRTSLTQQVAEELRVPVSSIQLVMGDTDLTPFDMGTFGSRTTPTMGLQLRRVAATARAALIAMAAERWKTDAATLVAADGKIADPKTGRAVAYGELTKGQKLVQVIAENPLLTPAQDWKIAGAAVAKIDGRDFVTGRHQYTSDMTRPGMLHGKVLRPTAFHAKLAALDSSQAEKMPGVKLVRDGDFVGVTAPDEYTAERAVASMRAQWDAPQQPSEAELFEYLRKNSKHEDGAQHVSGSIQRGLAIADKTLSQTYTVSYIAHVPLEPRAALAEWGAAS